MWRVLLPRLLTSCASRLRGATKSGVKRGARVWIVCIPPLSLILSRRVSLWHNGGSKNEAKWGEESWPTVASGSGPSLSKSLALALPFPCPFSSLRRPSSSATTKNEREPKYVDYIGLYPKCVYVCGGETMGRYTYFTRYISRRNGWHTRRTMGLEWLLRRSIGGQFFASKVERMTLEWERKRGGRGRFISAFTRKTLVAHKRRSARFMMRCHFFLSLHNKRYFFFPIYWYIIQIHSLTRSVVVRLLPEMDNTIAARSFIQSLSISYHRTQWQCPIWIILGYIILQEYMRSDRAHHATSATIRGHVAIFTRTIYNYTKLFQNYIYSRCNIAQAQRPVAHFISGL